MPRCVSGNHFASREGEKNCAACVNGSRVKKTVQTKLAVPTHVHPSPLNNADVVVDWEVLSDKVEKVKSHTKHNGALLGRSEGSVEVGDENLVGGYTFEELETLWELQKPKKTRYGFFVEGETFTNDAGFNAYESFAEVLAPQSLKDIEGVKVYFEKREEVIQAPNKVVVTDESGNEHDIGFRHTAHYGAAVDFDVEGSSIISEIMKNSPPEMEHVWMEFFRETVQGQTGKFRENKPRSVVHKFVRGFIQNTNNLEYLQEILDWERSSPEYNTTTFQRPTIVEDTYNAVQRIKTSDPV